MAREITVQQLHELRLARQPAYLVDVRQPEEHEIVCFDGDLLIPLAELPARVGEIAPPEGTPVVIYCHHGVRSRMAANFLEQHGVENVWSLAGGIDAWSRQIDSSFPRY